MTTKSRSNSGLQGALLPTEFSATMSQIDTLAEINRRLGINLLLEAAARDGIIIGEAGLLSRRTNKIPIPILKYWIKRVHPKLSEKDACAPSMADLKL